MSKHSKLMNFLSGMPDFVLTISKLRITAKALIHKSVTV